MFHIIDDAFVILHSRGVFRQAKVYRRNDGLYAGFGTGFIRLCDKNGTSHPNISWVETNLTYRVGRFGYIEDGSVIIPAKVTEQRRRVA